MLWYLVVLVGGDCDKLGLGENKGVLPSAPPQHVSGFNYVNSGLVAVQRVQDDLEIKEQAVYKRSDPPVAVLHLRLVGWPAVLTCPCVSSVLLVSLA